VNLFDQIEINELELAGAISRLSNRIDGLKRRRDSLISFTHEPRAPWEYQPATNIVRLMAARLAQEIREERRVLRDMRNSLHARQGAIA